MITAHCPSKWEEDCVFPFLSKLIELQDMPDLCLDFTQVEFVQPFGTVLVGNGLKGLVEHRKKHQLNTYAQMDGTDRPDRASSYLKHIGFFDYIGLKVGKQTGEATGSNRYAPITLIRQNELRSSSKGGSIQQAIEARSNQLASVLFPHISEQILVSYCLREVIRNVFEHAETDVCTVMAQRYTNGRAEITVLDSGIGVYGSLSKSHSFDNVDQALHAAIKPGISRVTNDERKNRWSNSGFGLYVLSELGAKWGEFVIASNRRYLQISPAQPLSIGGPIEFEGTSIKLVINPGQAEYFPNMLEKIVKQGEREYSSATGEATKASVSSKSLSTGL